MSINKFITNLDLARQAEIMSGETAVFQGGIELGIPFSGFPSGVDTSTIVSLGIVGAEFAAFSGNTGTTIFNVTDPSSPYYSISATTLSASPYTIIDDNSITETVSATTYPTIMTFTALSGDCCSTPISVSFTPPIIQELYDRGLYDGLFNGLGQASIGTTYIDESFYNVGSVFSGANLNMEIVEYGVHGATPAWVTGTTSGTVVEYSALTQYWVDPIYENLTSGLTLPITPESADTQTSDYVWTLTDSTIIDENLVGLQYTGYSVTYSFNDVIIDPESPSITGGVTGATSADTYYLGTVTATLENYSAGTLDYKGSTNWLIVNGSATIDERLTTDRLTIHTLGTGSPVTMLGVDVNGNVVGGSGGTTDGTGAFTSTTANNTIIPTNGAGNTNDSDYASILAGQNNTISGTSTSSAIVGGENNVVKHSSNQSSIIGGGANLIESGSTYSSIIGGVSNTLTDSSYSNILGGQDNILTGTSWSFIGGGFVNRIYGGTGINTIIGGTANLLNDTLGASILGGNSNEINTNSSYATIIGGGNNLIGSGGTNSTVLGGDSNTIDNGDWGSIIGGQQNQIFDGDRSVIVGGQLNQINDTIDNSTIFGGKNNTLDGTFTNSSIIAGTGNTINNGSNSSTINGGIDNSIIDNSEYSFIAGGEDNTISGHTHSFIIGGSGNTINYSPYVGDGEGILGSTFSTIEGSKNTSIQSSKSSGIYKGQTSSILSSVNVNIYNNNNVGTPNGLNTIIGSEDVTISGTPGSSTETKNNTVIGGNPSYTNLIKDSKSSSIVGGGGTIDNITMGGIFASNAIISGSSSVFWSAAVAARNAELYDSNTSIIIGGSGNYMNDSGSSLIAGGDGNVMDTSDHSAIVGGVTNVIDNALRSVILGGQNITGTTDDTVYMNNLYITQANGGNYYSDMDNSSGPTVVLSGSSSDLTRLTVTEGSGSSFGLGIRGATEVSFPGYGKQGDAYIYSTIGNNGINIISAAGSGTDDYIRFYAGGDASTLTNSDLMIVGSGLTRGYVGIGTDTPTEKLDIDGNLKVSGEITASGIPSYADDAAAGVGGLSTGEVYQTDGTGASPLNVAGILMIKQ